MNKTSKTKKGKKEMKNTLENARKNSTLSVGGILTEIVDFLKGHKKPASPVVIASALSVKSKKVRTTMQRRLDLAEGNKALVNSGIIELPNKGGFVRLTTDQGTKEDRSKTRYEWKRNIPKSW